MEGQPGALAPEMGVVSRIVNVFFAPAKAFESIGRKPGWDWLVPVAILLVLAVVGTLVVSPKIDVDVAVKDQMKRIERMASNLDESKKAEIEQATRKRMEGMTKGPLRFVYPILGLLPIFIVPLFYHGIAAAFGKKTTYLTVVAGYAYVQLVQALKAILLILVALPRKIIDLMEINLLVKSNLAAFADPVTTNRGLLALLANIDVFELWALALGMIALSRTTRLAPKAAAMTVGGLWVLWVLVQVLGGVIGSAFGG